MFAKFVLLVAGAAVVSASKPLAGVDPNSVQCDPEGQIFLLLPDYKECNIFYSCANGVEVPFICPPPLIFDFELQGCDWASSAVCRLRSHDIDIEGSGDDNIWWADESADASRSATQFTSILDCHRADSASRMVPYKGDCQRYWRCAGGALQAAACAEGLHFNARTQQCDHEANARCDQPAGDDELAGEFILYKN